MYRNKKRTIRGEIENTDTHTHTIFLSSCLFSTLSISPVLYVQGRGNYSYNDFQEKVSCTKEKVEVRSIVQKSHNCQRHRDTHARGFPHCEKFPLPSASLSLSSSLGSGSTYEDFGGILSRIVSFDSWKVSRSWRSMYIVYCSARYV